MHRTLRSARTAAALALTLGVALVLPGAAFAGTTEPTPVTTTSTTSTGASTGEPTGSTTTPATTSTSTSSEPTTTTPGTGTTTTDSSAPSRSSTTATPSTPSTTAAPKTKLATPLKQRPFGAQSSLRAALVPGDSSDQAAYAGGFVVRTLAARLDHYSYPGGFPDVGNTIDGILALDGANVGLNQADASTAWLADNVGGYTGSDFGALYASSIAKSMIAVIAQGSDPTDFDNKDLVAELESTLGTVTPGRFSDHDDCGDTDSSTFCDYSITLGQALAVIALGRATGSVPQQAIDYLLDQQCADGGFRSELGAAGGPCTSDPDATGFAAQALIGALGPNDANAQAALDNLADLQGADGGVASIGGPANANTTGVAAQAFAAAGRTAEVAAAQDFLAGLQYDCSFPAALRGGIAFTQAEFAARRAAGSGATIADSDLRATPQATLGLAGDSLLTVTAEDAAATAPTLTCSTPSTTTTTTTLPSTTTTTTTPAVADPASATPGSLAFTGSNVAALTLLGAMLLLVGAGAIVLARRKGVHA